MLRPSVITTSSVIDNASFAGPRGVGIRDPTPGPEWVGVVPVKLSDPGAFTIFSVMGVAV